jgi:hypothetical protein
MSTPAGAKPINAPLLLLRLIGLFTGIGLFCYELAYILTFLPLSFDEFALAAIGGLTALYHVCSASKEL